MSVLTLDLGTSATKAALWDEHGLVALTRSPIDTHHPRPGWAEQDAEQWWGSVLDALAQLPDASVDAIGFSAARETFVLVDERLTPMGPGVLWSDRRGEPHVDELGDDLRARTGVMPTGAATAAKLRWVDWVDYADLVSWISRADLCLGIFGTSEKAASVIPNKVYQVVAAGRPVVTRDSPAIRELLEHAPPCVYLIPPGDAPAREQRRTRLGRASRGARPPSRRPARRRR